MNLWQVALALIAIGLALGVALRFIYGPMMPIETITLYKSEWACAEERSGSTGIAMGPIVSIPRECITYRRKLGE